MSQQVGQTFKTRIPTLGDDASIEEALKVYHYGVDNYTSQPIPDDSIEGNFRSLKTTLDSVESSVNSFPDLFIRRVSTSSSPNIITSETTTTIPLVVRSIASQTSNLQEWRNSSNSVISLMSTAGYFSTSSYVSVGSTTQASTVGISLTLASSSHKGIVVRSSASQTGNLQEWQGSDASVLTSLNSDGSMSMNSGGVRALGNYASSFGGTAISGSILSVLTNTASNKGLIVRGTTSQSANLQEWQDSSATVLASISSSGLFSSSSISSSLITASGEQTPDSFRVRNTRISTSSPGPSDGNNGDIWIKIVA